MKNLVEMQKEAAILQTRIAKDRAKLNDLLSSCRAIEKRQQLQALVGVVDGVTITYGAHSEKLRGSKATIEKVNRTRVSALVDGERWTFPFDLIHVDATLAECERALNGGLQNE